MDEADIAAQQMQNVPSDGPVVDGPSEGSLPPADQLDTLTTYKLLDFFNVGSGERSSPEVLSGLREIYSWAVGNIGTNDYLRVVEFLRSTESSLGFSTHPWRLGKLLEFTRLHRQSQRIDDEMREFLNA